MDLNWLWDVNMVAAYAAILSTLVFAWDITKWWRGGAAFRVTANPNMKLFGFGIDDPRTFVVVKASNVGSMTTTITHVVISVYKTRLHRLLRRRPIHQALVNHSGAQTIPFEFRPGTEFVSKCEQDNQIIAWSQHYALYMGICHTLRKRELVTYVRPIVESKSLSG